MSAFGTAVAWLKDEAGGKVVRDHVFDVSLACVRAVHDFIRVGELDADVRESKSILCRILVESELGGAAHGAVAIGPVKYQRVLGVRDAATGKLLLPRRLVVHRLLGIAGIPALRLVSIPQLGPGVGRWRGRWRWSLGRQGGRRRVRRGRGWKWGGSRWRRGGLRAHGTRVETIKVSRRANWWIRRIRRIRCAGVCRCRTPSKQWTIPAMKKKA